MVLSAVKKKGRLWAPLCFTSDKANLRLVPFSGHPDQPLQPNPVGIISDPHL